MKKNMLTEINNIRRIMGLHLIMEDTKTEIYNLLKKLSSESTSEVEKNEIKAILRRANVTDEEIQRLLRGGEQTLTQLTRKIEGNLTVELSDDLEKILIKSGVASEAFRELGEGSGARLIDSVESLYTAMKNGQITMEDYLARKDAILNRFDEVFNREEMERATKSMEKNVDTKIENARRASNNLDIEDDIPIEDIRVNNPSLESLEIPTGSIENPDDILLQVFSPNAVKKVKKEFKSYTQKEIRDQFDRWKSDKNLSKTQIEKWDKFMENIDKNWWEKLSFRTKALFIVAVLYGPNVIYMMLKIGLPEDALLALLPMNLGQLLKPSKEEKQKKENTQEITDYLTRLENYRVLSIDGKKLSDMDDFYLSKLIEDFDTTQNQLKDKIHDKIESLVDSKKGTLDPYGMYQFGEEVSNEINKILLTVPETKNFKVELIKAADDDYLKPGIKTTLKGFKNFLITPELDKRQKTSYEQPKPNYPTNF